jgi:hypothetical protein
MEAAQKSRLRIGESGADTRVAGSMQDDAGFLRVMESSFEIQGE